MTGKRVGPVVLQRALLDDHPAVALLLEQQAMEGEIRIAMGRQPELQWSMDVDGDRHTLMVAKHQPTDRIVGCGCRSVCERWVNGQRKRVGYLGMLRRDPTLLGQVRLLREGWQLCDTYRQPDEEPYDLTCIVSDNLPARRLLERGLRNLPTYHMQTDMQTLVYRPEKRSSKPSTETLAIRQGDESLIPLIVDFLNQQHQQYQFAPYWDENTLLSQARTRDLNPSDFLLAMQGDQPVGVMAVWDQRCYKQMIVTSYAPGLSRWRWVINLAARLSHQPLLPKPNHALNMAFISHWAVLDHDPVILRCLLKHVSMLAMNKGIELLLITVACNHPCQPMLIDMIKGVSYPSRLYVTHRGHMPILDQRPTYVEAALL